MRYWALVICGMRYVVKNAESGKTAVPQYCAQALRFLGVYVLVNDLLINDFGCASVK